MKENNRNVTIDLIRFFASLIVMMHHSYIIGNKTPYFLMGGYIVVELFFMLSGYFTTKKLHSENVDKIKNKEKYTLMALLNKIKGFYFYVFVMIIIQYLFVIISNNYDFYEIIGILRHLPFDLLLLRITNISPLVLPPFWYLSALIFGILIFIYVYIKNKNLSIYILSWLIPCFIYGFIWENIGYLASWDINFNIFNSGLLRCIAGLYIGQLIFYITEKIKNLNIKKYIKVLCTIIILCLLVYSFYIMCNHYADDYDFVLAIIIIIFLICIFGNLTYFNIKNSNICFYLGKLSLPMYACHWTIGQIINSLNLIENINIKLLLMIVITIVVSIILERINRLVQKCNIKKIFLN